MVKVIPWGTRSLSSVGLLRSAVLGAALMLSACGADRARQVHLETQVKSLQSDVTIVTKAYQAQTRRLSSMVDRLGLLEDRIEAQAMHGNTVAAPAPGDLRTVRLSPRQAAVADDAARNANARTITQSEVDSMGGNLVQTDNQGRVKRYPRQPVPPPANAANAGNIGVMGSGLPPLAALTGSAPPGPGAMPIPVAPRPAANDPITQYKAARVLYDRGDLSAANRAFRAFVAENPRHGYADNALYWAGECEFAQARHAAALKTFRQVIEDHPTGNQVPSALLMIGLTQEKLGRRDQGRETLARLIAMYPETEAARRAGARLSEGGRM